MAQHLLSDSSSDYISQTLLVSSFSSRFSVAQVRRWSARPSHISRACMVVWGRSGPAIPRGGCVKVPKATFLRAQTAACWNPATAPKGATCQVHTLCSSPLLLLRSQVLSAPTGGQVSKEPGKDPIPNPTLKIVQDSCIATFWALLCANSLLGSQPRHLCYGKFSALHIHDEAGRKQKTCPAPITSRWRTK